VKWNSARTVPSKLPFRTESSRLAAEHTAAIVDSEGHRGL
jgi:hypothetical protein